MPTRSRRGLTLRTITRPAASLSTTIEHQAPWRDLVKSRLEMVSREAPARTTHPTTATARHTQHAMPLSSGRRTMPVLRICGNAASDTRCLPLRPVMAQVQRCRAGAIGSCTIYSCICIINYEWVLRCAQGTRRAASAPEWREEGYNPM